MSEIVFNQADHSYWLDGRKLESVTTAIKSIVPPFDRDKIAEYVSGRKGVPVDVVLSEWEAKSAASLEKGTRVHAYIEDVIAGVYDPVLAAVNDKLPEMQAFDLAWKSLRERLDAQVVAREKIVFSALLGFAGRVDAILRLTLPNGKPAMCVFDWKTGKFSDRNPFESLLKPWADLPNSEYHVYSLQTSLYRLMLEESGESYHHSYLVHLSESGTYRVYRSGDYRERLRNWKLKDGR